MIWYLVLSYLYIYRLLDFYLYVYMYWDRDRLGDTLWKREKEEEKIYNSDLYINLDKTWENKTFDYQTYRSESESRWVSHSYGLVPPTFWQKQQLETYTYLRIK